MNEKKLNRLFELARQAPAPVPLPEFAGDVLRAVRREPTARPSETTSLFEQLNLLFPRVALAAVAIIVLCVVADFTLTSTGCPGLDDGAAQLSSQWLFNPAGI